MHMFKMCNTSWLAIVCTWYVCSSLSLILSFFSVDCFYIHYIYRVVYSQFVNEGVSCLISRDGILFVHI